MKPLNPNSMIQGRYLIVQPIGKGGMGEVYLAVDQRLGSAVALKRTFFSEDGTLGSAFEREARILARLRHPVLPKVIDHFSEGGDQFLVMEHISGDDIAKRLEVANKPFPVTWVMFWSDQMLDALAYLHSHEPPIVHRDIKPQNLKLTDDNHIVLLDFGLSKDFDSTTSGLNSASVAGYSPHFASMEQIRGTGTDARSDLYSLAATLYQMLTNTVPPDALTRADALLGGKGDPIKPLNEVNPEVSSAISEVILKAVSIRQDERFGSAVEMQKALRRAFGQEKKAAAPALAAEAQPPVVTQRPAEIPNPPAPAPSVETPETETRIRTDIPLPLDATVKMDKPLPEAVGGGSEQKTAVFTNPLPEVESSSRPAATPVGSSHSMPQNGGHSPAVAAAAAGGSQAAVSRVSAPPAKKSSAGLIAGAVIGLVVLAAIAAGAAWMLVDFGGSSATANSNANTSSNSVSSTTNTQTPASSPAVASDPVGSNSANPANLESVPPASNTEVAEEPSTPADTRAGQTGTRNTPAKPKAPTTEKKPAKPEPKDERTVIVP